jgi:hypothetical protein
MNKNYTPLTNDEMIWHINTAFNCLIEDTTFTNTVNDFINMILLNSNY